MAIKDLLVAYDGNDASQKAVQLAVQMSRKYDAAITGVHIFRTETYESHIRRWIPDDVLERMKDAEMGAERTIESGFRDHLADAGYEGDAQWITAQGQANILLPRFGALFRSHADRSVHQCLGKRAKDRTARGTRHPCRQTGDRRAKGA